MKIRAFSLLTLLVVSSAQASLECAALFTASQERALVAALAELRVEAEGAPDSSLGRVLNSQFTAKYREAQSAGVNLSKLPALIEARRASVARRLKDGRESREQTKKRERNSIPRFRVEYSTTDIVTNYEPVFANGAHDLLVAQFGQVVRLSRGAQTSQVVARENQMVYGVQVSEADGLLMVMAGQMLSVYSAQDSSLVWKKPAHQMKFNAATDTLWIVDGDTSPTVLQLEPKTGRVIREFSIPDRRINSMQMAKNGSTAYINGWRQRFLMDLKTQELTPIAMDPRSLDISPDGSQLIRSEIGKLTLYERSDLTRPSLEFELPPDHEYFRDFKFDPESELIYGLAYRGNFGSLVAWSKTSGRILMMHTEETGVKSFALSADGESIAISLQPEASGKPSLKILARE